MPALAVEDRVVEHEIAPNASQPVATQRRRNPPPVLRVENRITAPLHEKLPDLTIRIGWPVGVDDRLEAMGGTEGRKTGNGRQDLLVGGGRERESGIAGEQDLSICRAFHQHRHLGTAKRTRGEHALETLGK